MSENKPKGLTFEQVMSKAIKWVGVGGLIIDSLIDPGINAESGMTKLPFIGLLILGYLININENLKNKSQ
ncbi:MAG: hypothetical protein G01um101416_838 [Microgenomates group bacterium Gr01-1014_16]|nr:MAG: hypothetical protein G01um101416_838 [Microgenomates group bacterium Gr01-1014_16]